jgi:hypothetical protein
MPVWRPGTPIPPWMRTSRVLGAYVAFALGGAATGVGVPAMATDAVRRTARPRTRPT